MPLTTRLLILVCFLLPSSTFAAGLAPWKFGMTKAEVVSFKEFGPYKTFSNGDLETFNGRFQGRKENIQFFFVKNRLHRIEVNLFEGVGAKKAIAACERAYEALQHDYGKVEVPAMINRGGKASPPVAVGDGMIANAMVTGKTQMAPVLQPKDKFLFVSVRCLSLAGNKFFSVVLFIDPPAPRGGKPLL
jgi:hypothetical protein